jgi:uncharacterized DUF497 family protein
VRHRRIEPDPIKDAANLRKHRLSLYDVAFFDWDQAVSAQTRPDRYGRKRVKAVSLYQGKVHVVIFSELGLEAYQPISFRRAKKQEREAYENYWKTQRNRS